VEKIIESFFDRLWPICRSITGNGLRSSFKILQEIIPLEITEVPTGTKVFDWEIPKEWNIKDAYIITPEGNKIADFKINNLHVVNYSTPVNKEIHFEQLEKHIYTLPQQPTAIPYITSYYKEHWGFCLSHEQFESLSKIGIYKVVIDSELKAGSLTYGDLVLKGESDKEIMFSTYFCHPSMANNELSGPLTLAFLYQKIKEMPFRKYTYRFVVAPETIGIISYLSKHGANLKEKLIAGYVLTCCGDDAPFVYKRSKIGNSLADKIAEHILKHQDVQFKIIDFAIGGSDERQYCSPGFNLPVGSLTRSMYRNYKEYHTSLDNKNFISFSAIIKTIDTYFSFVQALELNEKYINKIPFCEPQLGKREMYPSSAGWINSTEYLYNLLHFLSYADGSIDLIDIAEKRSQNILKFEEVVKNCKSKDLI
jgi:aminopeptidase-like protein